MINSFDLVSYWTQSDKIQARFARISHSIRRVFLRYARDVDMNAADNISLRVLYISGGPMRQYKSFVRQITKRKINTLILSTLRSSAYGSNNTNQFRFFLSSPEIPVA